jgi:hypothetical protein
MRGRRKLCLWMRGRRKLCRHWRSIDKEARPVQASSTTWQASSRWGVGRAGGVCCHMSLYRRCFAESFICLQEQLLAMLCRVISALGSADSVVWRTCARAPQT